MGVLDRVLRMGEGRKVKALESLVPDVNALAKRADEKQQVPAPKLTDRELEVLKLVAQGLTNREIADQLYISENTVKNHVRNILEKLHLHSRMEAVVYAVREKLLDLEETVGGERRAQ